MSNQARSKNELSSDETNNYWAAFFILSDTLSLCREKIVSQENNANDPPSQTLFRAARLNVETRLETMQTMRFRFNDGRAKISPPNSELIRSMAMVSAKVTGFAADPNRLPEVVDAIEQIFAQFQELHQL